MNTAHTQMEFPSDTYRETPEGPVTDVLRSLPVDTIVCDPAGTILLCRENFWSDWTGLPRPIGGNIMAIAATDEDRKSLLRMIRAANEVPARLEMTVARTGGTVKHALAVVGTIPSRPAGISRPVCVQVIDITDQKLREADLVLRETRWNNALVNSAAGVWDINTVTRQMYYTDTWRAIRGIPAGEPIENTWEEWLDKLHPDDREHVLHCIPRQNAGDPDYAVFEYRERHRDGHWVWIECRGACVERDENGDPIRVVGIDTDITARKNAEQAMERLSRRLRLAMETSRIGVFEADFDSNTCEWDDRMYAIFGVEGRPDILINGIWETRIHPEDLPRVEDKVKQHVAELTPFSDEYRIVLPDGSERHIFSRTLPFIDSDGHRKMIGANWDVTEDFALQRELERAKTLAEARNRELEEARISIEYNAMHDYLTDLPNRRYLDDRLVKMAQECRSEGSGFGILHIDLDRFKQINDTLGHQAGDMMLRHAARLLRNNIRADDFVARIGGDEFVILSRHDGSRARLSGLADRIIKELCKPVNYEGHACRFGASIGIATSNPGEDIDPKTILLNADIALYKAKNRGRNRHEFFSEGTQDLMISTRRTADDILLGLERSEFVPWYQFQFDARTLDITGVETLARWKHPRQGILTPDRFLDIAEDLDVVGAIDAMILEKALGDFHEWEKDALGIPKISVNVSSRRLHDSDLPRMLSHLPIEPGKLSFELLESTFLDDCEVEVAQNLDFLRKAGIEIEIDDFGTGHASIVSLLRVSPSALKIDRELIRLIPRSPEQRKLVNSIIDIGKSLNIKAIAEGVETTDHIGILRDLGCDILQGYALARPMPGDRVREFIRSRVWRDLSIGERIYSV